jgi:hypothetical protein
MKKVVVKNLSNIQTHGAEFETQELADAWIAKQKAKGVNCSWGRPAWTETLEDESVVEHEDQFTVEISDISSEVAVRDAKAQLLAHKSFGEGLVANFAVENAVMGITAEQSDAVLTKLAGVLAALSNGYLETAIRRAKAVPGGDYDGQFITAARLLSYVNAIETKLGISLSQSL